MIERYTLPEMGRIWSVQNRFQRLLDIEIAVAKAEAKLKIIPAEAAKQIAARAKFDVSRIAELEKTTRHDVIAFVSNVAESVGEQGRYVHFGLTSSDVLDSALSLQIMEASKVLDDTVADLENALESLAEKHAGTLCAGRTHGMQAEPTTFGYVMAGHLMEIRRGRERVNRACRQAAVIKLSGAVGTYSSLSPEVEAFVASEFDLPSENIATQVVPRDRHAEVFSSLALLGAGLERLAVEVRHLQRSEVGEAEEPFEAGQKGSSAMPHKRNPIASENVTGLSRLLRGYMVSAYENVALWHERDISHSSVERVIFPDAFIIAHYAVHRMTQVLRDLRVYPERMKANMDLTQGQIFSSHVLLELVRTGMSREEAYAIVQKAAHGLKPGGNLREALKGRLPEKTLETLFSGEAYKKSITQAIKRALK